MNTRYTTIAILIAIVIASITATVAAAPNADVTMHGSRTLKDDVVLKHYVLTVIGDCGADDMTGDLYAGSVDAGMDKYCDYSPATPSVVAEKKDKNTTTSITLDDPSR